MIDVIRNGELFDRVSPSLDPNPVSPQPASQADWFETILYLEMGWGARGQSHLWEGRLSLSDGEIFGVEPRFRGAEVVSPLEGEDAGYALPCATLSDNEVAFSVVAEANPNNATSATQGIALHCRLLRQQCDPRRSLRCAPRYSCIPLLEGALSGNLGVIDTPAYRFHPLPLPHQWQWQGQIKLGAFKDGENIYLRLRQAGGQMAWASPIYCRKDAK